MKMNLFRILINFRKANPPPKSNPFSALGLYILVDRKPVAVADGLEWSVWFGTAKRRVRLTRLGWVKISTVFLGLDHNHSREGPPLLFETMAWTDITPYEAELGFTISRDWLDIQERCSTWEEAEAQHERVLGMVREKVLADPTLREIAAMVLADLEELQN